jgi:hypothetical protein
MANRTLNHAAISLEGLTRLNYLYRWLCVNQQKYMVPIYSLSKGSRRPPVGDRGAPHSSPARLAREPSPLPPPPAFAAGQSPCGAGGGGSLSPAI